MAAADDDVIVSLLNIGVIKKSQGPFTITALFGRNINWRVDGRNLSFFVKKFIDKADDLFKISQLEKYLVDQCPDQIIFPVHISLKEQIVVYPFLTSSVDGVREILDPKINPLSTFINALYCLKSIQKKLVELPHTSKLSYQFPWALTLDCPNSILLHEISPAGLEILRIIQSDTYLLKAISTARNYWNFEHIIHGDVRLANFLFHDSNCFLIDWEFAQHGHHLWDQSCLLASLFSIWILSAPQDSGTAQEVINKSIISYDVVEQAIKSFMQEHDVNFREIISTFISIRLLQNAIECAEEVEKIPIPSVLLLQLAQNISKNPDVIFEV